MSCNYPITAFRSNKHKTANGKSLIVFNEQAIDHTFEKIELPCSRCEACKISRSREWALRCVHESQCFAPYNCMLTLTYNDENLPKYGSLTRGPRSDFTLFMKRVRKRYKGCLGVVDALGNGSFPIRFFQCGEYGEKLTRPHHHVLLFNFRFPDATHRETREGVKLYTSDKLDELWSRQIEYKDAYKYQLSTLWEGDDGKLYAKMGYCTIGEVNFQSAAYVARYILKKHGKLLDMRRMMVPDEDGVAILLEEEYITMSRRPGIGKMWFDHYQGDCYPKDFITHKNVKFKIPRYYDAIYDVTNPEELAKLKLKRKEVACRNPEENTYFRRSQKAEVLRSKLKRLVRGYEHAT